MESQLRSVHWKNSTPRVFGYTFGSRWGWGLVIEITGIFRNTISKERIESGSGRRREQYSVGCFDPQAPPPHYGFFPSLTSRSTFRLFSRLRVVKRSNVRKREASWTAERFSTNERQTRAAISFRSRTISSENPAFLSRPLFPRGPRWPFTRALPPLPVLPSSATTFRVHQSYIINWILYPRVVRGVAWTERAKEGGGGRGKKERKEGKRKVEREKREEERRDRRSWTCAMRGKRSVTERSDARLARRLARRCQYTRLDARGCVPCQKHSVTLGSKVRARSDERVLPFLVHQLTRSVSYRKENRYISIIHLWRAAYIYEYNATPFPRGNVRTATYISLEPIGWPSCTAIVKRVQIGRANKDEQK